MASSFIYHPTMMIGIGDLGNRTLACLHDTLPQHEPFVQLRGFHLAPARANAWSYALDVPQHTPALSRADVRDRYLWHLEQRQAGLLGHLSSATTHLKAEVYVYFFTDLQDPLSALLLDILHATRHVLTRHNAQMAIRSFIYVATPPANATDAGQFATLREWLRFSYAGVDKPQHLFHPQSPFAFLNQDHAVLFNRLFLYQPHKHLPNLWAEIGLSQLQNAPQNVPDDKVYSRKFIEHEVSNFGSQAQMKRITLTREIKALADESLLLCSAYVAYSLGLPKTYLHQHWQMTHVSQLINRCVGVANPAHSQSILRELAQWADMPPFIHAILQPQFKLLMQLSVAELHHLFMSPNALSAISEPMRQVAHGVNLPQPSAKITSATDFAHYYAHQIAYLLGDMYATDYPKGMYATTLNQCATITLRDMRGRIHERLVADLNRPLHDDTTQTGGVASALAWLDALHKALIPLHKGTLLLVEMTRTQLQQAGASASAHRQQIIGAGHLTRMGRLSPMAEIYRDNQLRDIQLKARYDSLCCIQHILHGVLTFLNSTIRALTDLHQSLLAHLTDLTQRQAHLKRPPNSTFCQWIHDEAWENWHRDFLWLRFSPSWRAQIAWSVDDASHQMMYRVGQATLRLSAQPAQTIQLDDWLNAITFPHDDTLWVMYADDPSRAKSLADSFKKLINASRYHPLDGHIKADHHLMLPFYTPNEIGATTFLDAMNTHLDLTRAEPFITPSGDKIIYLTKYEEQPLQLLALYGALAEKYQHFLNPLQHHLFAPERTVNAYEKFVDHRSFIPPIVTLFEFEARLHLFVLLHALDYLCVQTLDDTMRYLGVLINDQCIALTDPSHDPSWYDATYAFVWCGYFSTQPPKPIDYADLQAICDAHLNQFIEHNTPNLSRPHWTRINLLCQSRPNRAPEMRRIGVLLDVYLGYQDRLNSLNWGQSRLLTDLHSAFRAVALARMDDLRSNLARYQL